MIRFVIYVKIKRMFCLLRVEIIIFNVMRDLLIFVFFLSFLLVVLFELVCLLENEIKISYKLEEYLLFVFEEKEWRYVER